MSYQSRLTRELINEAYEILRRGNYQKTVCACLRIPRSSYKDWYSRGRKEQERLAKSPEEKADPKNALYLEFYEMCYQAKQEVIAELTEDIVKSDDVRIKYKLLRALDPKQFTEHYVIDDETGEVEETRTGEQIMAERLALLLESNKQDAD